MRNTHPFQPGHATQQALFSLCFQVDERKAAVEVERRRAQEAVAQLEKDVLELQCKLEAAQHRERQAAADSEQSRCAAAERSNKAGAASLLLQQHIPPCSSAVGA